MLTARMLAVAGLIGAASPIAAHADESRRVLVLDVSGSGLAADVVTTLSEVLLSAVREQAGESRTVIGQGEIGTMLSLERQKDVLGCADNASCIAEIGGALGAEKVIAGTVGKVGSTFVVSVRVIDSARAQVLRHTSERLDGDDEMLLEAFSQLGRHVVDPEQPVRQGYLSVEAPGVVTIDTTEPRSAPFKRLPLDAGRHQVALVDSDGRLVWSQQLDVPAYGAIIARSPFDAPPPPMVIGDETSSRWWLWTALGVVAVGSAAGAGYMLLRPPSKASGDVTLSLNR